MSQLLDKYLNASPEIVFEWKDSQSEAEGWLVINSLRNGAAGGGTRMRVGLNREEVISLAKVMGIKFSVCGPQIGGAKSGINFNPQDPRKAEVLERWFKAVRPLLKSYYGTGGDLNVDEVKDVFPVTERLGIVHPQEGVLTGHFSYNAVEKDLILGQLDQGCKLPVVRSPFCAEKSGKYNVADMVTGWGVAESVKHYYQIVHGSTAKGKQILIQGWGNVGSAAALYLSRQGAVIKGIIDREHSILSAEGLGEEEINALFLNKNGNQLNSPLMRKTDSILDKIWAESYDVFIPAAASRLVHLDQVDQLIANGLELVSCGANVPFAEDRIIFGDTSRSIDQRISLIPDFIANCGMARVFAYLMDKNSTITEEAIFADVSNVIKASLLNTYESCKSPRNLMNAALSIYLKS